MFVPRPVVRFEPGSFEADAHWYPRVLNAQIHPLVKGFLNLGNARMTERYNHLHPNIKKEDIQALLARTPNQMRWAGADLFVVTNDRGVRRVVVVETNSCPSGQKSMPLFNDAEEHGAYATLLKHSFIPQLKRRSLPTGVLAVLYDKNIMEASGYAATLADLTDTPVYLVPFFSEDPDPPARFTDEGVLEIRDPEGQWQRVRAAFRYVTQKPWNRIPPITKTYIYNPVLVCLAGGRNKMLADKAYDFFNAENRDVGLHIHRPYTQRDVTLEEIPYYVEAMGGIAVIKNPYSNAGQGVYTITSQDELDHFMNQDHGYSRFIVQALIGNSSWSSRVKESLYHLGTVPDKKNRIFVADVRLMVGAGEEGFFPVAVYARRAPKPLVARLEPGQESWDMLGTNLSYKDENGVWQSHAERLMLMDNRDFNRLGIGLDDLIEAYFQTVQAVLAIDQMAGQLVSTKRKFKRRLFTSLNPDPNLVAEIC